MKEVILIYKSQLLINYLLVGSVTALVFFVIGAWVGKPTIYDSSNDSVIK